MLLFSALQFPQPCEAGPGFVGGDPGGTLGLVFGVFGGSGFEDGGVGISGAEFGIDGDAGGVGVCVVQPTAMALSAIAARISGEGRVAFILRSLWKKIDESEIWIELTSRRR